MGIKAIRWILALAGWLFRGLTGAVIGYFIGYLIESKLYSSLISTKRETRRREYAERYEKSRISEIQTAYSVLGIPVTATADEIKSAYRRLARQYHPDTVASAGPDAQRIAESKFNEVREAYEVVKQYKNIN